ncbi:MAG: hypothetical protein Ct9H90mP6_06920 [Gammaproteobacteria bacterium]|nr:MAG: hypothetical protein Ct9H90mP6_06920 [Gammaproteobacteria bacterium]
MDEVGYANSDLLDSTILIIFLKNLCLIFLKSEKPQNLNSREFQHLLSLLQAHLLLQDVLDLDYLQSHQFLNMIRNLVTNLF